MHSIIVLMLCLRVNCLKREWWIDLPELTSIQFGKHAFLFNPIVNSSVLIMRSGYDEEKWWIDLPKLTSLTTEGYNSDTFLYPRSITLESNICLSILINRHALSHYCYSWQRKGFQREGNRSHEEFPFLLPLISRHLFRSFFLPLLSSFFYTPFFKTIHPTPD